ncbi:flagellar hook-length control protein FliK [Roseovarius aestuarii]|nr:flagellar hook-length control protein FliK [Roseovarius aestuarii]
MSVASKVRDTAVDANVHAQTRQPNATSGQASAPPVWAALIVEEGGAPSESTDRTGFSLSGDTRLATGLNDIRGGGLQAAQSNSTQTARHIAVQISEAIAQRGDRPIELTLNPVELGRVRISLSGADGMMTVNVLADRPETLDLMRRHIETLAQEFRSIGYDETGFNFTTGSGDGADTGARGKGKHDVPGGFPDTGDGPAAPAGPVAEAKIGPTDRLDIRL